MQVYKFGGASVKDATAVRNVATILSQQTKTDKVVVISAMGKTTNELERVINQYIAKDNAWEQSLQAIYTKHEAIIKALLETNAAPAIQALTAIIQQVRDFLLQNKSTEYNFIYDQVVSAGEYISTSIVSHYCSSISIANTLLDAKSCISTDTAYTEAKIDWEKTEITIKEKVPPLLKKGYVITQGFIGAAPDGSTTTLGREGSDYTAAIFSFALGAERMTVWKDVVGIMNADPKEFSEATFLSEISYLEAIEMTYYGATVIHPKTIKPLQNKNIPLEVRSFVDYDKRGSIIATNANTDFLPPIMIWKRDQTLLSFSAKDFSFIAEEHLAKVFSVFATHRLRINMMQNAAISFSICIDTKKEKLDNIVAGLQHDFKIIRNENLTLLTIRHYNTGIIDRLTLGKDILLRQTTRQTIQLLMR